MVETKTVIFDFEETLVHISKECKGADLQIPIKKKKSDGAVESFNVVSL